MLQGAKKLLSGSLLVVALQALNFVLLARLLGPTAFGIVATASAFATIALPLSGLGFGNVLLMKASRNNANLPEIAGNAVLANFASGVVLVLICMACMFLLTDSAEQANPKAIAFILCSELVFLRLATVASQLYTARSKFGTASAITILSSITRILAIGCSYAFTTMDIESWSFFLALLSIAYSAALIYKIKNEVGGLSPSATTLKSDFSTGVSFSIGTLCKSVYTDGDKIVLARYHDSGSVGIYSSAYRLSAMAFMPVRAILDASAHQFFQAGSKGLGSALGVSKKVMAIALPYSIVAGLILYFSSDLIPTILGQEYQSSAGVLKIIALLPLIQTIHYTLSDALTGANMQAVRTKAQVGVAVLYVIAALLVIPSHGYYGAAVVCVSSEATLAIIICIIILALRKRGIAQ